MHSFSGVHIVKIRISTSPPGEAGLGKGPAFSVWTWEKALEAGTFLLRGWVVGGTFYPRGPSGPDSQVRWEQGTANRTVNRKLSRQILGFAQVSGFGGILWARPGLFRGSVSYGYTGAFYLWSHGGVACNLILLYHIFVLYSSSHFELQHRF